MSRPDPATDGTSLADLRAAVARVEAGRPASMPPPQPPPQEPTDADADPFAVARAIVLRQLTGAPKSRHQLEQALHRRGCPQDVAAAVLDRFEQVGLVDDEAYAQMFVRSRQTGRGLASRALRHELRAKGIDEDTTRAVLEEIDPQVEREIARGLVVKKLRTMHGLERPVQVRRLAGMLARKGYGSELALRVIHETLDQAPEHRRD